jgi:uncharacterized protein (TIGR03437 family)
MNGGVGSRLEPVGVARRATYMRAGWIKTFSLFPKVAIRNLYPGIDAVFHGTGQSLEYDLELAARADASWVRIEVLGARAMHLNDDGNVIIQSAEGMLVQKRPRIVQNSRAIPARYVLLSRNTLGIRVGRYDRNQELIIDPELAFTKTIGPPPTTASFVALDQQGNIYVAGVSGSVDFPTTAGSVKPIIMPPLAVVSNGGNTATPLRVGSAIAVGVVGGAGNVIYAAGSDGIYVSGDLGATWRRTAALPPAPNNGFFLPNVVKAIAVDSLDPATVLVATSFGLFGSTSGGNAWFPREIGLPVSGSGSVSVSNVFYDPNHPLIAYCVTSLPGMLFRSKDAGSTWQPLSPLAPGAAINSQTPSYATVAAALSADGTTLYAVNTDGSFLKSTDRGDTWTKLSQLIGFAAGIQLDPSNPQVIYTNIQAALFGSTDGGLTFARLNYLSTVQQVAVDASGTLYVSNFSGISGSTDHGATFTERPGLPRFAQVLTSFNGSVYAGSSTPRTPFVMKLDPTGSNILYSTFVGGSIGDTISGLAVTSQGEAVLVGTAVSPDFPVTGAIQPTPQTPSAFAMKLSPDGSQLVYSVLLRGSQSAFSSAVTVDGSGAAYIAGSTRSTDFPTTTGVVQPALPSGLCTRPSNIFVITNSGTFGFVAKLAPDGSVLYSTYLTGVCGSYPASIAVGADGGAVVGGATTSPDFPLTANSYQSTFPGHPDQPSPPNPLSAGFIAKLSPAGDSIVASTLVGGGYSTAVNALTLDAAGNLLATGFTQGIEPGATPGVFQPTFVDRCTPTINIGPGPPYTGSGDAFVLKLDPAFSTARFLTYLGGSCNDNGSSIALDAAGDIWVGGFTQSTDFPLKDPYQVLINGGFAAELSPDASQLLFSTLSDGNQLAINASGVYVAGYTSALTKIDPHASPAVHVDSIGAVSGFAPILVPPSMLGLAPGQLIEIKGRNLGPAPKANAQLDLTNRLPFAVGGTSVFFGNIPAPIISVQASSIECFAPFEITSAADITVVVNGQRSNRVHLGVTTINVQILAVANADGTVNSADHSAPLGSTIVLYVSGLGETTPLSVDGLVNTDPSQAPNVKPSLNISGRQIAASFMGAAPGLIAGITQVNVTIPADLQLPSGGKANLNFYIASAPLYVSN